MNLLKAGLLALAAALLLTGCTIHISTDGFDSCRYQEDRSATVPVDGARSLLVLAEAGNLRVEGRPGLTEVRVRGTACATTENLVRDVDLRTRKSGDTIQVDVLLPRTSGNSPYLDLEIEVPENMVVRVEDTSGNLEIRRVAAAEVDDQSGDIDLIDIAGAVRVVDQSGEIIIRNAGADVVIPEDQSGNISIRGAKGNVTIDRDESGEIDIADVTGNVTIDEDQSGSIDVRDVKGDFTVRRDGSGGISYAGIGGHVSLPRK